MNKIFFSQNKIGSSTITIPVYPSFTMTNMHLSNFTGVIDVIVSLVTVNTSYANLGLFSTEWTEVTSGSQQEIILQELSVYPVQSDLSITGVHVTTNVVEGGDSIGLPETFSGMSAVSATVITDSETKFLSPSALVSTGTDYTAHGNLTGLSCKSSEITEINLGINFMVDSN